MIYYLEVISEGLSVCLDNDVNFYHHYKIGDIIKIDYKLNEAYLHFNNWSFKYDGFTIDWGKVNQKRLSVSSCINSKYIIDITKQIEREEKINKILSNESNT
jgi:hypothetical protein